MREEYWILHHPVFQQPKVCHLQFFMNVHCLYFSLFIPFFKTCFLTEFNVKGPTDSHWLQIWSQKQRWAHTESRSLLTLKLEDIQIWSRLGSSSFEIVLYFPILLTGSLFLAGRGTVWWCTVELHSPNRRPTKNRGCLHVWLTNSRNKL